MRYTRRDFGKLALERCRPRRWFGRAQAFAATRPNSVINGVHIGTITYSYRSMPNQTRRGDPAVTSSTRASTPLNSWAARSRHSRALPSFRGLPSDEERRR